MKIIAHQGTSAYLVQVSKDKSRVLDMDQKIFFKPFNTQSILARGYWEEYTPKEGELEKLLKKVREE